MKFIIVTFIVVFILWLASGEGRGQRFVSRLNRWHKVFLTLAFLVIVIPLATLFFWRSLDSSAGLAVVILFPIWLSIVSAIGFVAHCMSTTTFKWFLAVLSIFIATTILLVFLSI
jgi:hypothetical protein